MSLPFSKRLRELRKARGLKQSDVAQALSYGYSAISNYESGKNEPSLSVLVALADFFQVSTDYLLDRKKCKTILFLESFICSYSNSSAVEKKL